MLPNQALEPTVPACGGYVGLALSVTPGFFRYSPVVSICDTYGFGESVKAAGIRGGMSLNAGFGQGRILIRNPG